MLNGKGEDRFVKYCNLLLVFGLSLFIISCAPWRDSYLDDGVGVLTQPEVRQKLGKPHVIEDPLLSDETTWRYRYVLTEGDLDPWGIKTFGKEAGSVLSGPEGTLREKVYCYVHVLVFDKEKPCFVTGNGIYVKSPLLRILSNKGFPQEIEDFLSEVLTDGSVPMI